MENLSYIEFIKYLLDKKLISDEDEHRYSDDLLFFLYLNKEIYSEKEIINILKKAKI